MYTSCDYNIVCHGLPPGKTFSQINCFYTSIKKFKLLILKMKVWNKVSTY